VKENSPSGRPGEGLGPCRAVPKKEIPDKASDANDTEPVKKSILERPRTRPVVEKGTRLLGRPKKPDHEKKWMDKEYYRQYYHDHLKHEVQCDRCERWVTTGNTSTQTIPFL
jgi:hypothetical protein